MSRPAEAHRLTPYEYAPTYGPGVGGRVRLGGSGLKDREEAPRRAADCGYVAVGDIRDQEADR
ncbi:hypothetical protein [Streptomyces sp. NPDC005538]|uniref:hypothetical protein n=1 Tax=unclassified Streptomyces TaxID=2593676 RepID=UPI0033B7F919